MEKVIIVLALVSLLSACGVSTSKQIQIVEVPIMYCPEPPLITRPDLRIDELENRDKDNYQKVVKAYASTVKELQYHIEYLESQLDTFRRFK